MAFVKLFFIFLVFGIVTACLFPQLLYYLFPLSEASSSLLKDGWWGKGKVPKDDDTTIRPFTIKVEDSVLEDLNRRLKATRFHEPLEGVNFEYGFHSDMLKKVVDYWMNKFDWKKQENMLNTFPQYKTQIEGIEIHFLRVKPTAVDTKKTKVLPILLLHGWVGSFVEFVKLIPHLTTPTKDTDFVFEVICPSIPGWAFSEAPHHPGFDLKAAAKIFVKLMDRLGYKQYYLQGGDMGSGVAQAIALSHPERVLGLHLNMFPQMGASIPILLKTFVGSFYPSLFFEPKEIEILYLMSDKFSQVLRETGYMHIQSTKPDTIGAVLTDSPAGLAAYLLTLVSSLTNPANIGKKDGGLLEKFTLDELLTDIMVYWVSGTVTSSMRMYKESIVEAIVNRKNSFNQFIFKIPTAISDSPMEWPFLRTPHSFAAYNFKNLVQFTYLEKGGHFAAFEEPQQLAEDIWSFVKKVQTRKIVN